MSEDLRQFLIWSVFLMLPIFASVAIGLFCLSAPGRRNQRALLFLDLLETGLRKGEMPERTILSISAMRDPVVSVHFHLLAAHIEEGATLAEGLEKSPRLLPRGVSEVVKIGAAENALDRLLPAARAMLAGIDSRMRGALNYVMVLLLVVLPGGFVFLPMLSIFVWPKLKQVLADIETPIPNFPIFVFENSGFVPKFQIIVMGIMICWLIFYTGGSRVFNWARFPLGRIFDRLALLIPWRRRRAQRDFTGVLAVLLDAGLEETRAVQLAARASANSTFESRAERVVAKLKDGVALPEALKAIERDGEFQWRWASALRSGKGFFAALRGWHEALEARAFRQEQAASHLISSGIVLINGVFVGMVAAAVFIILISVIEEGTLW